MVVEALSWPEADAQARLQPCRVMCILGKRPTNLGRSSRLVVPRRKITYHIVVRD